MIINIFDIVNQPLQEFISWFLNVRSLIIAAVVISGFLAFEIYRAFRSVGMGRKDSKKWTNRATATIDVVQNVDLNKK